MQSAEKPRDLARDSVYQELRSEILMCRLRPGQMLQERDLVARLGISKSPIRDALLKLEQRGLIEVLPRKGYRVRQIDISDVRDMYGLRLILERECISLMMDTASKDVLERLDDFAEAPSSPDLPTWIDYNRAFHTYIAAHCGNARLAMIAQEIIEQFDRLTYVSVTSSDDLSLDKFEREHREIIGAIRAGDKRQAIALAGRHVQSSRKRVLDSLRSASIVDTSPVPG
ncbi:MAG: GntR family transcriptional regulator [Paracoccus sp. (in: a-proteobacteria)]|jgi:DNA-binding GntR family transcriptional regulator|uniref:GntR family transcriptional regulator n=1 Tax=Paracoccus sp. TaxID=267 RepID=UPI001850379B|nr:GntR family transcriptional regulator [Paracoccus sp. (in: a-proteobacteria)]HIC67808.1 GntR family transcriptional regulator [Paracoccus sp. (in: a-proteobacteria)]|tara:strand:- start:1822 stop:2505 length:684 start_codon:yes stop_codon:yes gene_type:complete